MQSLDSYTLHGRARSLPPRRRETHPAAKRLLQMGDWREAILRDIVGELDTILARSAAAEGRVSQNDSGRVALLVKRAVEGRRPSQQRGTRRHAAHRRPDVQRRTAAAPQRPIAG